MWGDRGNPKLCSIYYGGVLVTIRVFSSDKPQRCQPSDAHHHSSLPTAKLNIQCHCINKKYNDKRVQERSVQTV